MAHSYKQLRPSTLYAAPERQSISGTTTDSFLFSLFCPLANGSGQFDHKPQYSGIVSSPMPYDISTHINV